MQTQIFIAPSANQIESAVNAFLTPFVGTNSRAIRRADCLFADKQRYTRNEFMVGLSYQSTWGPQITSPYQLKVFTSRRPTSLQTQIQNFITNNSSYFFSSIRYQRGYREEAKLPIYVGFLFYSADPNAWQIWSIT